MFVCVCAWLGVARSCVLRCVCVLLVCLSVYVRGLVLRARACCDVCVFCWYACLCMCVAWCCALVRVAMCVCFVAMLVCVCAWLGVARSCVLRCVCVLLLCL